MTKKILLTKTKTTIQITMILLLFLFLIYETNSKPSYSRYGVPVTARTLSVETFGLVRHFISQQVLQADQQVENALCGQTGSALTCTKMTEWLLCVRGNTLKTHCICGRRPLWLNSVVLSPWLEQGFSLHFSFSFLEKCAFYHLCSCEDMLNIF